MRLFRRKAPLPQPPIPGSPEEAAVLESLALASLKLIEALRNERGADKWRYDCFMINAGVIPAPTDPWPKATRDWYTHRLKQQRAAALAWMLAHAKSCLFQDQPQDVRSAMWDQFFKRARD